MNILILFFICIVGVAESCSLCTFKDSVISCSINTKSNLLDYFPGGSCGSSGSYIRLNIVLESDIRELDLVQFMDVYNVSDISISGKSFGGLDNLHCFSDFPQNFKNSVKNLVTLPSLKLNSLNYLEITNMYVNMCDNVNNVNSTLVYRNTVVDSSNFLFEVRKWRNIYLLNNTFVNFGDDTSVHSFLFENSEKDGVLRISNNYFYNNAGVFFINGFNSSFIFDNTGAQSYIINGTNYNYFIGNYFENTTSISEVIVPAVMVYNNVGISYLSMLDNIFKDYTSSINLYGNRTVVGQILGNIFMYDTVPWIDIIVDFNAYDDVLENLSRRRFLGFFGSVGDWFKKTYDKVADAFTKNADEGGKQMLNINNQDACHGDPGSGKAIQEASIASNAVSDNASDLPGPTNIINKKKACSGKVIRNNGSRRMRRNLLSEDITWVIDNVTFVDLHHLKIRNSHVQSNRLLVSDLSRSVNVCPVPSRLGSYSFYASDNSVEDVIVEKKESVCGVYCILFWVLLGFVIVYFLVSLRATMNNKNRYKIVMNI